MVHVEPMAFNKFCGGEGICVWGEGPESLVSHSFATYDLNQACSNLGHFFLSKSAWIAVIINCYTLLFLSLRPAEIIVV